MVLFELLAFLKSPKEDFGFSDKSFSSFVKQAGALLILQVVIYSINIGLFSFCESILNLMGYEVGLIIRNAESTIQDLLAGGHRMIFWVVEALIFAPFLEEFLFRLFLKKRYSPFLVGPLDSRIMVCYF